ncbi:unnamed protein product [Sphagnum compactum]
MEESSSNSGGGDEDDVRSSEWEVISLSLSSHSLDASTTFETAAGTGQEEIGGEAVDVGFQSDYSFISSSSSSSPELQQQTVPSSDDDGDDDAAKAGSQPDFGQTGRGALLGSSCLSTPSSSPIILSRSSSLQLLLGEELCHNQVGEGNESGGVAATACLFETTEEEEQQQVWSSAGGLERTNLEFEFPDSDADMQNVELEKRKSSATLLGDGFYEQHTYETWWKWCRGILWCMQAQQATALWSISLAAAVMGLVILGHQWQHERCQNQQLQLQLCSKDEKISHLTYQVVRLREAMLGHRRVPVLRSSSVYHTF